MELRKDYILDEWVIIAAGRSKRPKQFESITENTKDKVCFFCPGSEHLTPPEIDRVGTDKKWEIRVIPNKFAAVDKNGHSDIRNDNTYFTYSTAYGNHEVIVETNDHKKQLWDLDNNQIRQILEMYTKRINEISKDENIKYVCVFKNHGKDGGTSLVHSHSQIIAYNKIPNSILSKVNALKNYAHCPYCEIINIEKASDRRCFENDSFVAFTPYASKYNYEIWVMPKKHLTKFNEFEENDYKELSEIMKQVLSKLKEINVSYNYFVHYSPDNANLHFSIQVCPRIAKWAGFELSSETIINAVSPEDAAKFYRGEL